MLAYVAKRLLGLVPVLLGVVFLVFSMLWLAPGDPVLALLGESAQGISAAQVEELRRAYGLDRSFPEQFVAYLGDVVRLDLGVSSSAVVGRGRRASPIEALRERYVRSARAKGVPGRTVRRRHALKSARLPVVTVVGLQCGGLLGGAVLTATVFAWPGVGRLLV